MDGGRGVGREWMEGEVWEGSGWRERWSKSQVKWDMWEGKVCVCMLIREGNDNSQSSL